MLAGFLGSGKTTLLNHLLHSSRGSRIAAVVNDFGAIEIDAMAVAGQLGDSTVSLGNGCLCCAVDVSELDAYLDRLTGPAAGIDVIVIEASGLAEPRELARMVLASENPRVVYGGLVEVVDAAEFDATRERHPEIERHLRIADLVVLNKTDRVDAAAREQTLGVVRSLTDRAAVVCASYGRIDPELLFDRKAVTERVGQLSFDDLRAHEGHADHEHLHLAYDSVSFTSGMPMDPRRTMAFLDSRPKGLYRIKGYIDFGAADPVNRYEVHAVGRFLRFSPEPWSSVPATPEPPMPGAWASEPWASLPLPSENWGVGGGRFTRLVLIGSAIDGDALLEGLAACRITTSGAQEPPDEHGMWGVLRYVRRSADEDDPAGAADAGGTADVDRGDAAATDTDGVGDTGSTEYSDAGGTGRTQAP
ncbi:cobalamin biosynthesis protein CobW [Streptomyces sulfonofaciens]|uniref:Cobalamin biosynthesis protein CobW n=1 Tax=Streptomyces sulfonofaciens TaxID=68272 RepID=A0A919GP31_9ACTN|nr:cobalamin biosynthesis protein CobW [Streptomyces sulfonofaciens]